VFGHRADVTALIFTSRERREKVLRTYTHLDAVGAG
jgi:hypothetical protein